MTPQDIKKLGEWLANGDIGISSKTMAAIALGAKTGNFNAPYDPSDFNRCYKLVERVPSIRNSFDQISQIVPVFAGILREWDELCVLFNSEKDSGMCRKTYARIKELRAESEVTT